MKYITKPVIIEAEQWHLGSHEGAYLEQSENLKKVYRDGSVYKIQTRQREVQVNDGDFIITLDDGESYPCSPEVFHKKYEPVKLM